MATTAEPAGLPPLGLKPDIDSPSPIFPFIVATVVLCSVLTTVFTAARLVTKRLVSECDIEDCKY